MIRFNETGKKEGDIAKTYGTTGGKVADILKNRNFAYVTKDLVPTAEQKSAAIAWLKQVPDYDTVGTDAVVTQVDSFGVATDEQAAAFLAARSGSRNRQPKAEGEATKPKVPKGLRAAKAKPAEATQADVDALLS
jgi:hypothetical protein